MNLTDAHMDALAGEIKAGRLKEVRRLLVGKNPDLSVKAVAAVAVGLPHLSHLSMIGMELNGNSVKALATGGEMLTSIDLRGSSLSPEAFRYIVSHKFELKSLDLFGTGLEDDHLEVLIRVCKDGELNCLQNLYLGGGQKFTGLGLQRLAEALPGSLQSLSFDYGVLAEDHVRGLCQASMNGALSNLCNFGVLCARIGRVADKDISLLVGFLCNLPKLTNLGLYCVATDFLLQKLLKERQDGKLPQLKQIDIMECRGIQPKTLEELHVAFPEQGLGYFEMGFGDEHADALVRATEHCVNGIKPLQNVTLFNVTNNLFTARGFTSLLSSLPTLIQLYFNGKDLDKLDAIAQVRRNGKLQKVTSISLTSRGKRLFSPGSLEDLVFAFKNLASFSLVGAELTDMDIVFLAVVAEKRKALQQVKSFCLGQGVGSGISYASLISEEEVKEKKEGKNILGGVHPELLALLLANLPSVNALGLCEGLTNEHVEAMTRVAKQGKLGRLTSLNLSNNPKLTNPKLLVALVKALRKNSPGLRELMLGNIDLSSEGWTLLLGELRDLVVSR